MNEPSQINPQLNLRRMSELGPLYAQAKANRIYLEEFRKSLKARLMKESGESSIGAQEREAYACPEYGIFLDGLKVAIEQEDTLRFKLVTAQAAIEVWRSQEASNRTMDRSAA
jgi:hypothetical protein